MTKENKDKLLSNSVSYLRMVMPFLIILVHTPFLYKETIAFQNGFECTMWILLSAVIAQLAVPTFFFISGYYYFKGIDLDKWEWKTYGIKIKKRIKTLLCPYLIWNILYLVPSFCLFVVGLLSWNEFASSLNLHIFWDLHSSPTTNIIGITRSGAVPIDGPLWFVRDLMVFCLLSPIMFWILKKFKWLSLMLGGVLYALDIWFPFAGFSKGAVIFMAGGYLQLNKINPLDIFYKIKKIIIILTPLLAVMLILTYGNQDMFFSIGKRIFRMIGIPFLFMAVSHLLITGKVNNNAKIESCSFFIFASHYFMVLTFFPLMISKLSPGLIESSPLMSYLIISLVTEFLLIAIKLLLDHLTPQISYFLNGCR